VHSLLKRQLRAAQRGRTDDSVDLEALLASVEASYLEFERERRLNDRSGRLMEDEIMAANARIEQEASGALSAVFRTVGEGILQLSESGDVEDANPEAERIFGGGAAMLIGRNANELISLVGRTLEVGKTFETETMWLTRGPIPVEVSVAEFQRNGRPRFLAIVRDITLRKSRERDLIIAREAAESANLSKSHFLASMSHELRTPLNAILGFAEVIRDRHFGENADDKYVEYADGIHMSGKHLLSLIDDILDISKIEYGGSPALKTEPVDLGALARDAVEMMRGIAANKNLDVQIKTPTTPVTVAADARALRQVALNLLANAVKFTPPRGKVEAIVESEGGGKFTVRDNGIGIAREDLAHVFEPFHRGNSHVARDHPGTGLGLAITRKLVELHGGEIELESDLGQGTSVVVRLPKAAA
jgi:PAS domain S-box-containing protein